MSKKVISIIVLLLLLVAGYFLYTGMKGKEQERTSKLYDTVVSDITDVLRVTVLESEEVVPITYRTGKVKAFGIGYYRTRISFDVEHLEAVQRGDTLYVRLPQPEVRVLEDETRGFTLLDVWSDNPMTNLLGVELSTAEENKMRARAAETARSRVSSAENLSRARSEAAATVSEMLSIVPGTVVVYTSPFDALPNRPDRVLLPHRD